jgi:hypothetical protein
MLGEPRCDGGEQAVSLLRSLGYDLPPAKIRKQNFQGFLSEPFLDPTGSTIVKNVIDSHANIDVNLRPEHYI